MCVFLCVCVLLDQLTDQGFNVEAEISTFKIRVCSIPVKHNLSNALIYQLVVLRPIGEAGSGTFKEHNYKKKKRHKRVKCKERKKV